MWETGQRTRRRFVHRRCGGFQSFEDWLHETFCQFNRPWYEAPPQTFHLDSDRVKQFIGQTLKGAEIRRDEAALLAEYHERVRGRTAPATSPAGHPFSLDAQGASASPRGPGGGPEIQETTYVNPALPSPSPHQSSGSEAIAFPPAPPCGVGEALAAAVGASGGSREPRASPPSHPLFPPPDEPANPNRVFGPPNRPASASARRDRNFWPLSGIRLIIFFCKRDRRYKRKFIYSPFGGTIMAS